MLKAKFSYSTTDNVKKTTRPAVLYRGPSPLLERSTHFAHPLNYAKPSFLVKSQTLATKSSSSDIITNYFWNLCFDKGRIKSIVSWFLLNNGEEKTVALLDRLKEIGFASATKAGISLGIDDLKIPPKKLNLLYHAGMEAQKAQQKYKRGDVLDVERFQLLISSWHRVSEVLKTEVIRHFEQTNTLNPVYMMAFSGARGNISQVRQLVGMRGLMADPQGRIIDFPILSNFREGLTLTEYLISCYGARKGIVDTALRTANAGYLTRRLVDVSHHVIISQFDCGTLDGLAITPMKEGNKLIYSLANRLIGRVLAETITNDDIILANRNQELSHDLATKIAKTKTKVLIRSPLTCSSKNLVCQLCYGWSLADGRLVSIGEAVGIIAAQSIGEPGTQLTMRTFHTGGVFSSDVSEQIKAPYDGIVHFWEPILGTLVRTPEGNIVFLTKAEGGLSIQNRVNPTQITKYKIPAFTLLFIRNKQRVSSKDLVAQITGINQQTAQRDDAEQTIISELEGEILFSSLRLRQTKLLSNQDLNSSKMEVCTDNAREKRANSIGILWLLSGKIYDFPLKTSSFVQIGDFIKKQSSLNEVLWFNFGTTSCLTKRPNFLLNNCLINGTPTRLQKVQDFRNSTFDISTAKPSLRSSFTNPTKLNCWVKEKTSRSSESFTQFVSVNKPQLYSRVANMYALLGSINYHEVGYRLVFTNSLLGTFPINTSSYVDVSTGKPSLRSAVARTNLSHLDRLYLTSALNSFHQHQKSITNVPGLVLSRPNSDKSNEICSQEPKRTANIQIHPFITWYPHQTQTNYGGLFAFENSSRLIQFGKEKASNRFTSRTRLTLHQLIGSKPIYQKHKRQHFSSLPPMLESNPIKNGVPLTKENHLLQQDIKSFRNLKSLFKSKKNRTLSTLKHSVLIWVPQEFYTCTGFSTINSSSYHHFSLTSVLVNEKQNSYFILEIPLKNNKRIQHRKELFGQLKMAQSIVLPRSSKRHRFSSNSFDACPAKSFGKYRPMVDSAVSLPSPLTQRSSRFAPPIESKKTMNYFKTTIPSQKYSYWNHSTDRPNLLMTTRQGYKQQINRMNGLVTIVQQNTLVPQNALGSQKSKLSWSQTLPTETQTRQTLNIYQQVHYYNITVKKGFVYIPTPSDSLVILKRNKTVIFPGRRALETIVFHKSVMVDCFMHFPTSQRAFSNDAGLGSFGVLTGRTLSEEESGGSSRFKLNCGPNHLQSQELTAFNHVIKNPQSRFNPISTPALHSHLHLETSLLVLFRETSEVMTPTKIDEQIKMYELFTNTSSAFLTNQLSNRFLLHQKVFNKQYNFFTKIDYLQRSRSQQNQTKCTLYLENRPFKYKQVSKNYRTFSEKMNISRIDLIDTILGNKNQILTINFISTSSALPPCFKTLHSTHTGLLQGYLKHTIEIPCLLPKKLTTVQENFQYFQPKYVYLLFTYYPISFLSQYSLSTGFSRKKAKASNHASPPFKIRSIFPQIMLSSTSALFTQLRLKAQSRSSFFDLTKKTKGIDRRAILDVRKGLTKKHKTSKELLFEQIFKQLKTQTTFERTKQNFSLQPQFLFQVVENKHLIFNTQPSFMHGLYHAVQMEQLDLQKTPFKSKQILSSPGPVALYNYVIQPASYFVSRKPLNFGKIELSYHVSFLKEIKTVGGNSLVDLDWQLQNPVGHTLYHIKNCQMSEKATSTAVLNNGRNDCSPAQASKNTLVPFADKASLNLNSMCLNSTLPGIFSLGIKENIDRTVFLGHSTKLIGNTKSSFYLHNNSIQPLMIDKALPRGKTSCLAPFEGELISIKQTSTSSQLLLLTKKDLCSFSLSDKVQNGKIEQTSKDERLAVEISKAPNVRPLSTQTNVNQSSIPLQHKKQVNVGSFLKYGDAINSSSVSRETGYIIHVNSKKLTIRRSQFIAASNKAVLHVKPNDWIEKNIAVITLPFQRLKAGDIVQGIPKIEQYFEARKSKAGRFYRDSIPNLMNAIFNHYLSRFRLMPFGTTIAVKKTIIKIQQILLNGIQRVYRTQGVSIADKHIEIIVRQMTSKVRILNPGLTSFVPGELIDANLMLQLNLYLEEEIYYEPIILGITQASLEVDSFISASSFQQTTRVLSEAALSRKRDYLRGLKENVILGNLMPAGTGHRITNSKRISLVDKKGYNNQ